MIRRVWIKPPTTRPAEEVEGEMQALRVQDRSALARQKAVLSEFQALEASLKKR